MTSHTATEKQKSFLAQLMLSSTFTAAEAQLTYHWLETPACTRESAKRAIDKALKRIDARDQARQDAADRQNKAREARNRAIEVNGKQFQNTVDAASEASRVLFG